LAARVCPQCSNLVPATCVMALTDGMECPHCHARLSVETGGRTIAIVAGLIAGWLAWQFTQGGTWVLDQVLPEVYAILAFGIVSPLVLMGTANLRLAPIEAAPAPAAAGSHGHAPAHH